MAIVGIVMTIISVNMIITLLINSYLMDLILNRFKAQDEFDEGVKNHICNIYDIVNYNGLVKPINNKESK